MAAADDRWLPPARRSGQGPALVCFAPAGAGAGFFRDWGEHLDGFRLMPVQLPGREERFGEAPLDDAVRIAREVARSIVAAQARPPYLLGYSYGALLAFETAHALEAAGLMPAGLVACARAAPQATARPSVADEGDEALLDCVGALGGLPEELLKDRELTELILPALRADFRANDGYAAPPGRSIAAPVTVIAGQDDGRVAATAEEQPDIDWRRRTRGAFVAQEVPGGHFFVLDNPGPGFAAIRNALALEAAA